MESEGIERKTRVAFSFKINKQLFSFLATFGLLLGAFYFLSIQFESYIPVFNIQTTSMTLAYLLKLLGLSTTISGGEIELSTFILSVVRQCTGLFEIITLLACVLAYPTNYMNKLKGILIGAPMIYFANIIRLVLLAYLGVYYFPLFELVHDYILQVSFLAFVIFIWLFWIDNVVKKNASKNIQQQ